MFESLNFIKKIMGLNNIGENNTGYYNSGYRNSGNYNSGDYNSGYCNSGNYNSGNYNSGYCNSGYRNSGNYNSGYCNSGYRNSGWFNTDEPKMRFFNKDSDYTYSEFSEEFNFVYPDLKVCAWINKEDMGDVEKKEVSGWNEMGGYLKTLSYKEAWEEYWNRASESDKKFFMNLPNFDAGIFAEVTGINVETKKDTLKVGDQVYHKEEVEKALRNIRPERLKELEPVEE